MVLAVLRPVLCHARVGLEVASEERESMESKLQSAQEAVQAGSSSTIRHLTSPLRQHSRCIVQHEALQSQLEATRLQQAELV